MQKVMMMMSRIFWKKHL